MVAGLKRPYWRDRGAVTADDPQGSGDHVIAPAACVRDRAVRPQRFRRSHALQHSNILRTVEVLNGVDPLNMYDAEATPMFDAFSSQPDASAFTALAANIPMVKNPGKTKSMAFTIDGPDSSAIPEQEWRSIRGMRSLVAHREYLQRIGRVVVANNDDP